MEIAPKIHKLKIGNEYIERIGEGYKEEFFIYVEIRLDEFLSWDYHSKHICIKISSANFALSRVKHILPLHIRKLVYNSLVRCHIEYSILAFGGCNNKESKTIGTLQKRAVRTVANKSLSAHTDPVFGNLGIMKFDELFQLNTCIFMHKYINNKLPESDMFKPLSEPNKTKNFYLRKLNLGILTGSQRSLYLKSGTHSILN